MTILDNELIGYNSSMRKIDAQRRIKNDRFSKYETTSNVIIPDTVPIQPNGYGERALIELSSDTYDIISNYRQVYVPRETINKRYDTTPFDWTTYNESLLFARY